MANVKYDETNCSDLAKSLKIDKSTVQAWCRKGYIHCIDVSEKESKRPRYLIPDSEVDRITKLVRKYGKRKWLLYNEEIKPVVSPLEGARVEETMNIDDIYKAFGQERPKEESSFNKLNEDETEVVVEPVAVNSAQPLNIDADEVTRIILKLQDIKEELENIEARKNKYFLKVLILLRRR